MAYIDNTLYAVAYNGIQLSCSHIENFESETIYSEDGVDRLYNKITMTVRGLVNGQINITGQNNGDFMAYLRKNFSEPRRPLQVLMNGAFTINFPGTSGAVTDAKQGPFPRNVKIYKIEGASILVEFTVEYYETICPDTDQYMLSNRYSQSVDIDTDNYTTITTTGNIVYNISKDPGRTADFYRHSAPMVSIIFNGFMRVSQRYTLSSDGTTLNYEIVDKETFQPPPIYSSDSARYPGGAGITRWEGQYFEESDPSSEYGVGVRTATLTLSAFGTKLTPRTVLMTFLCNLLNSRIKKGDVLKYYRLSENLNESSCSLIVSVYKTSVKNIYINGVDTKIQIPATSFGDPVVFPAQIFITDENQATVTFTWDKSLQLSDRGTAKLVLRIKEVNPTCNTKNNINSTPPFQGQTGPSQPPQPDGNPDVPTKAKLKEGSNSVKQTEDYPYVSCNIEQQIIEVQSVIQLPKASGGSNDCFYARPTQPLSKTIVRFRMERLNKQPDLPNPTIAGRTLLKKTVLMSEPALLASGVDRLFVVQGEYVFGYDQTAKIGENTITMPKSLIDNYDIPSGVESQLAISSSAFVPGLIS